VSDDGYNLELEPGSAVMDQGDDEMAENDTPPAKQVGKMKTKGPGDFGMPSGLSQSPTILNT
jgi:hypothetical protein